MELQARSATRLARHLNLQPGNAVTDARAKRLGCRLLGGKTGCEALGGIFLAQAIGLLARRENAVQKAVAKAGNRLLDARHFRQIDSGSNEHLAWRLT